MIFTPLAFLTCGILLLWEFSLNDWETQPRVENPSFGPSAGALIDAGAKRTDLIVDDGQMWRLISRKRFAGGVVCGHSGWLITLYQRLGRVWAIKHVACRIDWFNPVRAKHRVRKTPSFLDSFWRKGKPVCVCTVNGFLGLFQATQNHLFFPFSGRCFGRG